jgi:hypothetical protein
MTEHHDRVVGGDKLIGLDNQIGQLATNDVKPGYKAVVTAMNASPRHGTSMSGSCHSISSSSTAIKPGTSWAAKHRNTSWTTANALWSVLMSVLLKSLDGGGYHWTPSTTASRA